jgi:NAD(P)-dependent dehydrogenase (short-subunit alcohol dehydrogenase family)
VVARFSIAAWSSGSVASIQTPAALPDMQRVVRHLVETGKSASIVNIISMGAHCGQSYSTPYSASKGALALLPKSVANAYAPKRIRCNGILTGCMDTPGGSVTQQKFHDVGEDWLAKAEAGVGVMTGVLVDYDQNVAGAYSE